MQGKEASEQETKVQSNVGIDISKCWLDAHVLPGNERLHVANTCAGIRRLKRWLSHYRIALVAIEATGKWHRHLHRSLVASAIPVAIVDPYRVRMFAKAQGILAKTDQLDARVLALFAAMMAPPVRPVAPQTMAELAELVVARGSAVEAQTALKNQFGTAESAFLKLVSLIAVHQQSRQGYCRTRPARSSRRIKGRRQLGQTLCRPDLHPEPLVGGRRNPYRLPGRDRQHDRQTDRHAGRPGSDRRSIG